MNHVAHDVDIGLFQGMSLPLCQMLGVVWIGMGVYCSFARPALFPIRLSRIGAGCHGMAGFGRGGFPD